jgi:hypothetical protein
MARMMADHQRDDRGIKNTLQHLIDMLKPYEASMTYMRVRGCENSQLHALALVAVVDTQDDPMMAQSTWTAGRQHRT